MSSFVVWKIADKRLVACIQVVSGTAPTLEGICNRKGLDPNDCAATTIDQHLTTRQFLQLNYIGDNGPEQRPNMPCSVDKTIVDADGFDFVTISGAPALAVIQTEYEGEKAVIGQSDGDDVELVFNLPGDYQVTVSLYPYVDWTETINAT